MLQAVETPNLGTTYGSIHRRKKCNARKNLSHPKKTLRISENISQHRQPVSPPYAMQVFMGSSSIFIGSQQDASDSLDSISFTKKKVPSMRRCHQDSSCRGHKFALGSRHDRGCSEWHRRWRRSPTRNPSFFTDGRDSTFGVRSTTVTGPVMR